LLDRLTPTIGELTAAVEQEAKKWPEALRLAKPPELIRQLNPESSCQERSQDVFVNGLSTTLIQ
jgi:hypothetical protein